MEKQTTSPFKVAATYGLYLAAINIVLTLIIWSTSMLESLGMMATMVVSLVNLVVTVVLLIVFTKLYRNNHLDGKITFGKAFSFGVIIIVLSAVIGSIFSFILYKFIDPGYMERIMTSMQEKMYQMLSNMGTPEAQIEEAMRAFQEKGIPTAMQTVQQALIGGLIGGALMSLISAAIVKKNVQKEDAFEEAMEEVKTEE